MEAAAARRPVVAYDVRGVREVIDPASGLLAPRGDTKELRRIVSDLLEDPSRREELGEACRRRVLDLFAEDDVIERLRTVYSELSRANPA
jgi:glycosyltransferase involved in cell wall biosynthesis